MALGELGLTGKADLTGISKKSLGFMHVAFLKR